MALLHKRFVQVTASSTSFDPEKRKKDNDDVDEGPFRRDIESKDGDEKKKKKKKEEVLVIRSLRTCSR